MHSSKRNLVRAVKADIRHTSALIAPDLANRPEPEMRNPEVRFIQAAQNTLRTCLEATLKESVPFTAITCVELAIRLASYAISALPIEDQDLAMEAVVTLLPAAHSKRVANGIIIQSDWNMNGSSQPNVPGGRA